MSMCVRVCVCVCVCVCMCVCVSSLHDFVIEETHSCTLCISVHDLPQLVLSALPDPPSVTMAERKDEIETNILLTKLSTVKTLSK